MKETQPPSFVQKLPARNKPSYALHRVMLRYILIFILFAVAGILFGRAINERFRTLFTNVLIKFSLSTVTQTPTELSQRLIEIFRLALPGLIVSATVFASGFTPITALINSVLGAVCGFFSGLSSALVFLGSKDLTLGVSQTLALALLLIISAGITVYLVRFAADAEIFGEKARKCLRCGEKLFFQDYTFRYILSFLLSVGIVCLAGTGIYLIIFLVL